MRRASGQEGGGEEGKGKKGGKGEGESRETRAREGGGLRAFPSRRRLLLAWFYGLCEKGLSSMGFRLPGVYARGV